MIKFELPLPFEPIHLKEAREAVNKEYWKWLAQKLRGSEYRKALKEFMEAANK